MAKGPSATYERAKTRLKMRLADVLDGAPGDYRSATQRQGLLETVRQFVQELPGQDRTLVLSREESDQLIQDVVNDVVGLGPLDRLLADDSISEIMVNGPSEIFIERDGRMERVEAMFRDSHHLMAVIERMLSAGGQAVNESDPLCDASLPDGTRINVVIPPLALNGPVVTIRKKLREWTMEDYLKLGCLSEQAAQFLRACVRAKVNLVVSGGTSTGKTTLVGILSASIPREERVITIENVAELELPGRKAQWVRLVGRPPNIQGRGEIPLRILVKNALRMRPDRIILGEARGGEALDVVQAMHSGHDGFLTVLHANSSLAALERLETLMLMSGLDLPPAACRMQIASAVDLVVYQGRFADGSRRIGSITQVLGASSEGFELEELFTFEAKGFSADGKLEGGLRYTGARPKFLTKFRLSNVEIPDWLTT